MKIAIIGGGPAGAILAHDLGKAGVKCTLFDKHGAWEKPCGGGVPPKVRDLIPEVNDFKGPYNEVSIGEFVSPMGKNIILESRRPMWVLSRKDLGAFLLKLATQNSDVTYKQDNVTAVKDNGRGFTVISKTEEEFDFVVGADGCYSVVGRAVGAPLPRNLISMCFGYFIEGGGENLATSKILPAPGYVWAYQRADHTCIGGGSIDKRVSIRVYVRDFIRERFPDRKIISQWAAPIPFMRNPNFFDKNPSGKNWALIGDAAGHVDAITGEGIVYALLGGRMLAKAIIEGKPSRYYENWRDTYGKELKKASELSVHFYNPQRTEKAFRMAENSPTMKKFLMKIMTEQPSYLDAGKEFRSVSWKILLESLRGWL